MTVGELLYNTDNKIRQHSKLEGVSIPTNDIELFLNEAQELLIKKYFETFHKDDESRVYIQKLVKSVKLNNIYTDSTNVENGMYFDLPSDLKFIVREEVEQTDINGVQNKSRVEPISDIHFNLNAKNPFKKSYKDLVLRLSYGISPMQFPNRVSQLILNSGYTLQYYNLTYIRKQAPISLDGGITSELDETCHHQLINTAIDLIIKSKQIQQTIKA